MVNGFINQQTCSKSVKPLTSKHSWLFHYYTMVLETNITRRHHLVSGLQAHNGPHLSWVRTLWTKNWSSGPSTMLNGPFPASLMAWSRGRGRCFLAPSWRGWRRHSAARNWWCYHEKCGCHWGKQGTHEIFEWGYFFYCDLQVFQKGYSPDINGDRVGYSGRKRMIIEK